MKNKLMIIIVLAVFCVVLIIAVIGLIFKMKGQVEDGLAEEDELEEEDGEKELPVQNTAVKASEPEEVSYVVEGVEELADEAAAAKEENKPSEKTEEPHQTEEQKDDFLMDLDDDDFTFFDYDEDDK